LANVASADLDRLKFDTAKRLAEYYKQEGKRLTAQQIVQRLENFSKTGDASRNKLREGARKFANRQATKYKKEADKSLIRSASKDAKDRAVSKAGESFAKSVGKSSAKGLGRFAFGPIGFALGELAAPTQTGIQEPDIANYYRKNGVFPEDIPEHIDINLVFDFIGQFESADMLRQQAGAEPLQPMRDRQDVWGRAYRYITEPQEVKADPGKSQQQKLKEQS
tara:strand:- start:1121 stop:1786 length:666 start_codon:yes stop_codon:yes gene_type:complete